MSIENFILNDPEAIVVIKKTNKSADIEKNNPNRDNRGRFTFGAGGPQAGGAGGAGEPGEPGEAKDITSDELGRDYGQFSETKLAQKLRNESNAPETRGDPVLKDIAKRQGFDGEADLVDQKEFDKIVADGGTVTYRGVTDYYDGPGPDAKYIEGESAINEQFAKGPYFAGKGMYGSGTYTSTEIGIANHYAFDEGSSGAVVTMVVKPNARIATPAQYAAVRQTVKEGKGGFMGADNEGRVLAAQGFDGYRPLVKDVDAPGTSFIIVTNRKALAVLKK
jgi:hypothetical protein